MIPTSSSKRTSRGECPKCGSEMVYLDETVSRQSSGRMHRMACQNCGEDAYTQTVRLEQRPGANGVVRVKGGGFRFWTQP